MFKEGIEYIVHSHSFKNDNSLGTTQQLKRVVNASRNLALMFVQFKEEKNPKHEKEVSLHHNVPIMVDSVPMIKHKCDVGTISFICSIFIFSFLLINNVWLVSTILNVNLVENGINVLNNVSVVLIVSTILNVNLVENGINVLNNVSAVLIVIMMSQMYMFQEIWTNDTRHLRQTCPHFNSK